jgi:glycoprotein endo-alpha-1,2-mannosidase
MRAFRLQRWSGIGVATAALMGIAAFPALAAPAPSRSDITRNNVSKQVLAFYYGWYGNPEVSKRWYHWKDVDVTGKHIAESTHYPVLGPYDSHDPKVVDRHCREASDAGITGFIVSWWRQGDFHDEGMRLMLDTAKKYGLKISAYYETVSAPASPSTEATVNDLIYIMKNYSNHPAWLKVDGRPVVFIYSRAIGQLKLDGWQKVMGEFRVKYPQGAVFIGDNISPSAAQTFDGIHTYNPTGLTKGKSPDQIRAWAQMTFPEWVKTAGANRISCITIIPGYDDSVQPSRKPPRPITDRFNGETYRIMWENAITADPDWVIIASWNEWHEGSEIEPSAELGDQYLRITKRFASQFLAAKSSQGKT